MSAWVKEGNQIVRDFEFKNFNQAIVFVNDIAYIAEEHGHHPDIFIHGYKHVRLTLSTHSEGKVTEKDYKLAEAIDKIT